MKDVIVKKWLGNSIEFKMINGMVYAKATSMATPKKLENWKASPNTKRYIEALETNQTLKSRVREDLIISTRGGDVTQQGTWIHEKLVLSLARYISVEFELWCDEQISTLIREGEVSLQQDSYMINDPVARAQKWIEEEQVRQQLLLEVKEMKPSHEFVTNTFNPTEGSILVRDFAKMIYRKDTLEIGEKKLYEFLREKKIVTKTNKPMQNYIEMGIFEMKNTGTVSNKLITYVTNKGQTYLYNRILKEYGKEVVAGL